MSKKFNIHDWQDKQRRLSEMQSPMHHSMNPMQSMQPMQPMQPINPMQHSMKPMDFGPNCPQYDGPEHEGVMARGSAMELANDASDIVNMIGPNTNLPEWVESKITLAADYLNKVKDYLTHYEASRQKLHENIAVTPTFDETHEEFMARCEELGNSKDACMAMHGDHIFKQPTNEQNFDARLAQQMGMSDDEFEDQIASRDIGDEMSFPGSDDDVSAGYRKASDLKDKLRQEYRSMSDQDLDDFSVEMIKHFLDNVEAKDYARKILNTTTSRLDTL
tara:strand:- start:1584 stop:2411 length:828 start_codon:yes stop_codon:yes gene_type:complete